MLHEVLGYCRYCSTTVEIYSIRVCCLHWAKIVIADIGFLKHLKLSLVTFEGFITSLTVGFTVGSISCQFTVFFVCDGHCGKLPGATSCM